MNHDPALFEDLEPIAPQDLEARYAQLRADIEAASDADELQRVITDWESTRRACNTWAALLSLRYSRDTTSPENQQTQAELDAWRPEYVELEASVKRALLAHPARGALEQTFGPQAFALWDADRKVSAPKIQELAARENRLSSTYTKLIASLRVDIRGERVTSAGLKPYMSDPDRGIRREAYGLLDAWMSAHAEELDTLYAELVSLRHEMAQTLGYENYVAMGYDRRRRVGYGPEDVDVWRTEVRTHVVPLAKELRARQAQELGLERLMAWDRELHSPQGNPKPAGDEAWMIERAREMFDALDPEELGPFFRLLSGRGYMDLEGREGKASGGFCTGFPTERMPYIFANFNGSKGDVTVFTHEVGHAFQFWKSAEHTLSEYTRPTADSAELHSMSLEFLTWPHMEKLFGEAEAERFRRLHLTERLTFLPYGVAVDHFQHLVYERPEATPGERLEMWREMEATYLPSLDWGDVAYGAQGRRWQLQRHIYWLPFYYIDYTLAQAVAFQFWDLSERDAGGAIEAYKALCARGGTASFGDLVATTGFLSPLQPGSLAQVAPKVLAYLDA